MRTSKAKRASTRCDRSDLLATAILWMESPGRLLKAWGLRIPYGRL